MPAQRLASDFPIIKMNLAHAQDLVILMSLAGDENHVARRRGLNRDANGFSAISFDNVAALRSALPDPGPEAEDLEFS